MDDQDLPIWCVEWLTITCTCTRVRGSQVQDYGPLVPPITDLDPATKSSWCPEDWEKRLCVVRWVCVPPADQRWWAGTSTACLVGKVDQDLSARYESSRWFGRFLSGQSGR
jgi:hypothetical protein